MTESPADLIEVQHYVQGQTGLPWDALGIKHATPQGGGYHEGNDLLAAAGRLTTDYSKRESSRDRPGTNSASAFDLGGEFPDFRSITLGIVFACQRADPRTRDIREVIYTPDGVTVRRWDRLGVRSSGDTSHLSHTHTSFFRDSEGRRNRSDNFLGLLRELFEGDTTMGTANWPEQQADLAGALANAIIHGKTEVDLPGSNNNWEVDDATRKPKFIFSGYGVPVLKQIDEIHTAVKAGTGQSTVTLSDADKAAITQALAGLVPTAAQIADELAKRLGNG